MTDFQEKQTGQVATERVQPKNELRLMLGPEDGLEAVNGKIITLEKFYLVNAEKFARENGLVNIDEENSSKWKYGPEYDLINSIHKDLVENPGIVFLEIARNARIHGNGGDVNKKIEVYAKWENDLFELKVKDEGHGFGSSALSGDGMGMILVGGFSNGGITFQNEPDGFSIEIKRDLKAKLNKLEKETWEDESVYEVVYRDKFDEIRDEIKRTGKVKLEFE